MLIFLSLFFGLVIWGYLWFVIGRWKCFIIGIEVARRAVNAGIEEFLAKNKDNENE